MKIPYCEEFTCKDYEESTLKILFLNIMFFMNIKETKKSKLFTFFSNSEIIALTSESNFGIAKASSKAVTIASSDVHTAFMDPPLLSTMSWKAFFNRRQFSTCSKCLAMIA